MNDYKTPGNYYCNSNGVLATLANCPAKYAFNMRVYFVTGLRFPAQEVRDSSNTPPRTYMRWYNINTSTWSPWSSVVMSSDITVLPLFTYHNWRNYSSIEDAIKAEKNQFGVGTINIITASILGGLPYIVLLYKYGDSALFGFYESYDGVFKKFITSGGSITFTAV